MGYKSINPLAMATIYDEFCGETSLDMVVVLNKINKNLSRIAEVLSILADTYCEPKEKESQCESSDQSRKPSLDKPSERQTEES